MGLDHKRIDCLGDQYFCRVCGKSWDTDDRDPPACETAPTPPAFPTSSGAPSGYVRGHIPSMTRRKMAWTVYRPSTKRTALAYAGCDQDVTDYAAAVLAWPEDVVVRRFPQMDPAASFGRGVFFEMNPSKLATASQSAHAPIVSLKEFIKGEHE